MSPSNNRKREPGRSGTPWWTYPVAVVFVGAIALFVAVRYGSEKDGVNPDIGSLEPLGVIVGLFDGSVVWPPTATLICAVVGAVVALFGTLFLWARLSGRKERRARAVANRAASHMATEGDLEHLRVKEATAKSRRLGVKNSPGIPLGKIAPANRKQVFASFEDMTTLIAGPRVGKSTSFVIPAVMAAPGAMVTTSNKRDVLDATRDVRAAFGQVWVFDPQRVAREEPTWWWNPLTYVTDDTQAAKLAGYFAAGSRKAGSSGGDNAHFEANGKLLLASFLLAAAVAGRPIRDVYTWTTEPTNEETVRILRKGGYPLQADGLLGLLQSDPKPRSGYFVTAQEMASSLQNTFVSDWINPRDNETRPEFKAADFVRGRNTLYSLSKEGAGTAGPLVTALTAATLEAATDLADVSANGRMQTPLVAILDEAANVCRWPDLPDLYSHFGSRGIPIMSVFQSYSQGVAVFGKEGMEKLRSASNVFIYAGGVRENDFLKNLSELVGTYDRETTTESFNKGVRSTSTSLKREPILEVDELANLPRGYAVMLSSGARAAMLRTIPWFRGPKKQVAAIKASIAAHDPSKQPAQTEDVAPAATPEVAAPTSEPVASVPAVDVQSSAPVEDTTAILASEDTTRAPEPEDTAPVTSTEAVPAADDGAWRDLLRARTTDAPKDRTDDAA